MHTMKLIVPALMLLTTVSVGAKPYTEGSVAPVPNLMPVIMHHGEMLDLSETQKTALKNWREANHHAQHALNNEIREDKKAMLKAALAGISTEELLAMEKAIEAKRVKFISKKAACRDNMKSILKPEQWQKVMAIYQEENGLTTTASK